MVSRSRQYDSQGFRFRSIQGAAVKFVMIEGLHHEFTGIPGTDTDYVDFILKLKRLAIKSSSLDDITLELNVSKLGMVTAGF